MKVKEESGKVGLKLNIWKMKIMASGSISSWEIDGKTVETVTDFIFGGLQNQCREYTENSNIMAAVTICSDFGAQENKVCHCFHYFPIYLP